MMLAIKSFSDVEAGKIYVVAERGPDGRWVARSYHKTLEGAEVVFDALMRARADEEVLR